MERAKFEYNKISEREDKKFSKMLDRVKNDVSYEFEVEHDQDTLMVHRTNEEGKEIGMGFTKVGDTIKFPNVPILDVLKNYTKKEK